MKAMRLSNVDRWVIGYSAATSLAALLFAKDPGAFVHSHLFHAAAIAVAVAVATWVPSQGRYWPFVRSGYPVLLLGFFYSETGPYVFLFFSHWSDPALLAFETAVLGFSVPEAVAGVRSVWLLELWMFGYVFYYLMLPLSISIAIVKNEQERFRRMMEAACVAFFVSFALFSLFPLEGPRYALVSVLPPIEGGWFFHLVMAIQNGGSIHGGCMPSSHTAVAWVLTWYVHQMDKRWGRALMVISALLSVGCFWGRFHYVTDVVVGFVLFVAAVTITEWRHRRALRKPGTARVGEVYEGTPCIR